MAALVPKKRYKYQPLQTEESIRILILSPSNDINEPLRGELECTERAQILQGRTDASMYYETVSYAWGMQTPTESLFLEKNTSEIKITKNVDCILRNLRRSSVTRSLWIDALCLNQDDKDEKSVQVPLMGKIYAQAKKVHIWLGDSDEGTTKTWAFLRTVGALGKDQINETTIKSELQHIWGQEGGIAQIEHFLRRSWFSRRWVLQEVALSQAAVVRCGKSKISWNCIASGLEMLEIASRGMFSINTTAQNTLNIAYTLRNNTGKILDLIWDFHTTKCADPRDKIFALYGLAINLGEKESYPGINSKKRFSTGRIHEKNIEQVVDYNTSWENIYLRFTQSCLESGYISEIDHHLSAFGSLASPSWVPDWRYSRPVRAISRLPLLGHLEVGVQVRLSRDPPALEIETECTDDVNEIYPNWLNSVESILHTHPLLANPGTVRWAQLIICCLVCAGLGLDFSRTEQLTENIRKLVTFRLSSIEQSHGFDLEYFVGTAGKVLQKAVFGPSASCYSLRDDTRLPLDLREGDESLYESDMLTAVSNMMGESMLFQSASGAIGLGPKNTRPGDRICGFTGTPWRLGSGYIGGVLHLAEEQTRDNKSEVVTQLARYRLGGHCICSRVLPKNIGFLELSRKGNILII